MALQTAAEFAERHELVIADRTGGLEHRVDERRGVALREDQVVVRRGIGLPEVVSQVPGKQDSDEVRCGERRRWVSRTYGSGAPNAVNPELPSEVGAQHTPGVALGR